VNWIRPPQPSAHRYAEGFRMVSSLAASGYSAPAKGLNVFSQATGWVEISGGGLPPTLNTLISFGERNAVVPTAPDPNSFKCTLNPANGSFSGSFLPIGGSMRRSFKGVVLQKSGCAVG